MKKSFLIIVLAGFSLVSCDKILKDRNTQAEPDVNSFQEQIGGAKDEHGCISSAGFTWSNLREDCVQLFEVAYRLNPVTDLTNDNATDVAVISAFVLFNEDQSAVEIFLPEIESGMIIEKTREGKYQKDIYQFDDEDFALYINNKKVYQAAKSQPKDIVDLSSQ
ncbi:MAG TPA: hypothetical protein VKY32_05005 [Flavobacterium sp.]|nr:hypothetical protein [Flavobacterium sp.]